MYEAYFHLLKRPFSATPDPSCLFSPEPVQKVLDDLRLAIQSGQGIGILTAAAGTGKTLLCRRLLLDLEQQFTPVFLANANFPTRRDLLQAIHFELGRRYSGMEEQELRLELIASLENLNSSGRPAALIVDEAHLLNEQLLEELRALASFARDAQPLLRMLLVGQMELELRLIEPSLEALNQRIVCHSYLDPLTRTQSREFVDYRIHWAGGDTAQLFDDGALELIAEACGGVPRCLNQLSDHSLLLAFVQEAPRVSRTIVEDALADLRQLPLHWNETLELDDESTTPEDTIEMSSAATPWRDERPFAAEPIDLLHSDEMGTEPGAAYEIGGEAESEEADAVVPRFNPCADEFPAHAGAGIAQRLIEVSAESAEAPVRRASITGTRTFREEFVEDRYAALDIRTPGLSRTFGEAPGFGGTSATRAPLLPPLPEPVSRTTSRSSRDSEVGDAEQRERAETRSYEDSKIIEPVTTTPEAFDTSSTGRPHHVTAPLIEPTSDIPQEIEEEISGSVLDVCLDVQNSLGQWWDPRAPEAVVGGSVEGNGIELRHASPFDVVEPDVPIDETRSSVDSFLSGVPFEGKSARFVPAPSFRHLFSRLRRKAGRTIR